MELRDIGTELVKKLSMPVSSTSYTEIEKLRNMRRKILRKMDAVKELRNYPEQQQS